MDRKYFLKGGLDEESPTTLANPLFPLVLE